MYKATGEETTTEADAVGWSSSQDLANINKCIVAQTKTGNYIVFSNAAIVAKGDQQDKNITLGISAVAMESEIDGVAGEYPMGRLCGCRTRIRHRQQMIEGDGVNAVPLF